MAGNYIEMSDIIPFLQHVLKFLSSAVRRGEKITSIRIGKEAKLTVFLHNQLTYVDYNSVHVYKLKVLNISSDNMLELNESNKAGGYESHLQFYTEATFRK